MRVLHRVVIALTVASIACGGGGDKTTSPGGTTNPGGTGGMTGNTPNSVGVYDNEFIPASITVAAGTTVTWNFHGSYSAHNVTMDNGSGKSPDMMTGSYARTFDVVGTFTYKCSIHGAAMSGTIVVQ